ncbi:MAG: hypothetical protein GY904_33370 [Planctomycetaceae bacterium]|jgi:hypothetical protein|nr:hypothetical protein [Planctomycetaceae bacterium]
MSYRSLLSLLLVSVSVAVASADKPALLKMFQRTAATEADPNKTYELSEEDGPWMILASTFVGDGAKTRAAKLALEIRSELNLPAFIYKENFDFTGTIDRDPRTSKSIRYANRYRYDAYAVLVGEYDSVEHPGVEGDLKRIRAAKPKVFQNPNDVAAETDRSNPVTTLKSITTNLFSSRKDSPAGPMGQAFVTRNPMLPEQFFKAPPVDSFVHEMNDGLQYSLLKCEGKYTVVVKTFEGLGAIVDGKADKKFAPSEERLNRFLLDAEKMTSELRKQGVEAYQFHDRYRSLVTVGSFESLGRELPDGKFEYTPEIRAAIKRYSAFNVRPELARQVPAGTKGIAANGVGAIPFDVEPTPIAVPKSSKRSLYGSKIGMR